MSLQHHLVSARVQKARPKEEVARSPGGHCAWDLGVLGGPLASALP